MELLTLAIIIIGLAVLGALANTMGVDSREPIDDDWSCRSAS